MSQDTAANINLSVTGSATPEARLWAAGLTIYALTLLAYLPVLNKGSFIWDDDSYIVNNPALKSPDGLKQIWFGILPDPLLYSVRVVPQYYPMTVTSFWLEYRMWEANPRGYHIVNVLLHATSAVLLWIILRKLAVPGAWVIAAIFALHPVQVESVAWITERKNVLSGAFYLASLLVYMRFCGLDPIGARFSSRSACYIWALLLFLAALLSKSVTATLPAAVLLVIWWKRGRITLRDVVPLLPFFACALAMGWVTRWMEWNVVGAQWTMSLPDKLIVAGRAPWFYASKLVWPLNLMFIYPRWPVDAHDLRQFAYPLITIAAVVALSLLRRRIGREPLVAVLFFLGTLFPALGFFAVFPMRYSFVADHFQYLACIGMIALLVAVAHQQTRTIAAMRVMSAVVIVVLGALTWQRATAYSDLESLWRDTIARNPDAWMAHNNYGSLLLNQNRLTEAAGEFSRALEIKPDHADAIMNLGIIAERLGDAAKAESLYRRALGLSPPASMSEATAHAHLGALYGRANSLDEAAAEYEKAIALAPGSGDWLNELGIIRLSQGKMNAAMDCFGRMIDLDPNSTAGHFHMGLVMLQLGRSRDAVTHWTIVLKQRPDDFRVANSLGNAYLRLNMRDKAIEMFRRALQINPEYEPAKKNLAAVGG